MPKYLHPVLQPGFSLMSEQDKVEGGGGTKPVVQLSTKRGGIQRVKKHSIRPKFWMKLDAKRAGLNEFKVPTTDMYVVKGGRGFVYYCSC